jgi:cellulose synthase/poly-beta-1,6-N-acetylglucosamine synthase-like glycosyltransferase
VSAADTIVYAWQFLSVVPLGTLLAMLWLTLIIEIPRYFLGLQATCAALLFRDRQRPAPLQAVPSRVSLLLVGHNEEGAIESCVRSLRQQTFSNFEIVCVDDGSSDKTFAIMGRLQHAGLIQRAVRLQLRGGKAAGINLAARVAKGDIFVVVDCDCSFDLDAIENLVRPLVEDQGIGAVCGNILVRNWRASVTASLQAIEYLICISLGKAYANHIDQVCCVSGAFGAFRRTAWEQVYGMDTGGGEDLDFTIRLRLAGHKVVFARHSICYTDVPDTLYSLLRQRNRWERDAFWIRFRKFQRIMNPRRREFSWRDAVHQWDFVLFNMVPTLAFPFYLVWLVTRYDQIWPVILVAVCLALYVLDVATFVCAVLVTGKPAYWRLFPFLVLYGPFQSYVMRLDRCYAYVTEWIYSLSLRDNYVPQKVRDLSHWR